MTLNQTRYQLRAGESTSIDAPRETLDFLAHAKTRRVEIAGKESARGFVVGPSVAGDQVLLVASLAVKPGEYRVQLSATSGAGEEQIATMVVTVHPMQAVPVNTAQPPVILINGFQRSCPITVQSPPSASTFGNLEGQLNAAGVPVYFFDNCAYGDVSIEALAGDLGQVISTLQYADGTPVAQVDIVAHSMGGLIARGYLAGIQTNDAFLPPPNPTVSRLVLIATPNFGSFEAANGSFLAGLGTQSAEMIPGSAFLWDLGTWNQLGDDLRGVDAIAIIGNAGSWSAPGLFSTSYPNASDGVVSLTSASLSYVSPSYASPNPSRTRILPYCHTDPIPLMPCSGSAIANTTEAPETGQIILSFLAGTSDWMSIGGTPSTDAYLSQNGGVYFAVETASGQSYLNDVSAVVFGNYSLLNEAATDVFYSEFATGTATFQAESASLGQVNYGPVSIPTGHYTAMRAKYSPAIFEVTPLLAGVPGWVVRSGETITISGAGFGQNCPVCQVFANDSPLQQVYSWSDQAIAAFLPASYSGLVVISVQTASGGDAINIMAAQPPAIAVAPSSLQFPYTMGGTVPPAQSVQVTNTGGGTLTWSATATAAWLALSAPAPSTLAVSLSPAGLSAGTYTSSVQISAAGASNSPVSITVTLTVAAAPPSLATAPQALTFNYTVGGAVPAVQNVSITNAGGGALSWAASAGASWLSLSSASGTAPGTLSVSVNPATLAAGTYTASVQITASGASRSPASVGVKLTVQAAQPVVNITAVTNGASFQPDFASAAWVSIFGTNLSESTRGWQAGDFVNGLLPTSLDGVSVTIDGLPAYVEYVSPTQINALVPDDAKVGPVQVQVTTAQGTSNSFPAQKQQFGPAFFTIGGYVAALHADYTIVAKAGLIAGVTTRPAKPGEVILLYATGFGPTNPPLPSAQLVTAPAVLADSVQITIGGVVAAPPAYAGLVGAGLYQFNVTVPNVANGDAPVVAQIGGVQTQTGVSITIQQ
jgi:uncharacterized protein (TIGR03437 family)